VRTLVLQLVVFAISCGLAAGQAQYKVLYTFGTNGPGDGAGPNGGLVFDKAGNIYGTTLGGGAFGFGAVFELSPMQDGTWQETVLYNFCSVNRCVDGKNPSAGLVSDPNGNLYGMTTYGGESGVGVVFDLSPPSLPGNNWTEQVLWSFGASNDGELPYGGLVIDASGNLYGTTSFTITEGGGTVFKLSPGQNGWTETILHNFCLDYPNCWDGVEPMAGVTVDKAGNLYGTTMFGGGQPRHAGWGLVYQLSPTQNGWTETVLKAFTSGTGGRTSAGITIDPQGNLYGGVSEGGPYNCGGYFRVNRFVGFPLSGGNGCAPQSDLLYSSEGLFGLTGQGGRNSQGALFKLTKAGSQVKQTMLYDFCEQPSCSDGRWPNGSLTLVDGQLYGATYFGGSNDIGVIFQITIP